MRRQCIFRMISGWLSGTASMLLLVPLSHASEVTIGVMTYQAEQTEQQWHGLARALERAIPGRQFRIQALYYDEVELAVAARNIDFLLTNPANYIAMSNLYGLSAPLATVTNNEFGETLPVFGGVIFALKRKFGEPDIRQLKGKSVAVTSLQSMSGYLMQAFELQQHQINPSQDIRAIVALESNESVVSSVLAEEVDFGFVRTGILERMAAEGGINLDDLIIINQQPLPNFPVKSSTRLYPEWPLAALPIVPSELAKQVVASLFTLDRYVDLHTFGIHGFDVPADYAPVIELMQSLKAYPFDIEPELNIADLWQQYFWLLMTILASFVVLASLSFYLLLTRQQLFRERRSLLLERQLQKQTESRLRSIIENEPESVKVLDADGRLIEMNAAGLAVIGADNLAEAQGLQMIDLVVPKYRADFEALHRQVIAGLPAELEFEITGLKGTRRLLETHAVPIEQNGQQLHLAITRDITHQRQTQQSIIMLTKELVYYSGQVFFQAICQHIGQTLQLDYVLIGTLNDSADSIQVQAGWAGNQPMSVFSYSLAGSPCEKAVTQAQEACVFIHQVAEQFPDAELLRQIGVQSYFGQPLLNKGGSHCQGILVAMSVAVREDSEAIREMLRLFAPNISAEIHRQQDSRELKKTRKLVEQVAEHSRSFLWEVTPAGLYTYVSDSVTSVIGYRPEELVGKKHFYDLIPDGDRLQIKDYVLSVLADKQPLTNYPNVLLSKQGQMLWVSTSGGPVLDEHGELKVYRGIDVDITEQKAHEEQLTIAAMVFDHAREGIMLTSADAEIISVNRAFSDITGFSREEVIGKNPSILSSGRQNAEFYTNLYQELAEQGQWSGDLWNRRKSGEVYAQLTTISVVRDEEGEILRYVALFSDITPLIEHQNKLKQIAHYDVLTGLPNRILLADHLKQGMIQAKRHHTLLAAVFIDLDGFKEINDQYGHDVGDDLLILLADKMKNTMREGDTIARLGGDEFVAILLDLDDAASSNRVLNRLLEATSQPFMVNGMRLELTASIGVSFYPQMQDIDADQLIRQADQAMYQSKLTGKNRFHVFDAELENIQRLHNGELRAIEQALIEQQFVLFYQPKVNMRTGEVVGLEALIRWQHPEKGLLGPMSFLPAVQSNHLDIQIGEWVVSTALSQIRSWQQQGVEMPVSVNISAHHLQERNFVERLQAMLAEFPDVKPQQLELEILESSEINNLDETPRLIAQCRELGVSLALDDFGTGYSSLNYLKHLKLSTLKIDQSFVRDLLDDPEDMAILESMIGIGSTFQLKIIAEGVETIRHGSVLLTLGCVIGQGYGIAMPMPAKEFLNWLQTWHLPEDWLKTKEIHEIDTELMFAYAEINACIKTIKETIESGKIICLPDASEWRLATWVARTADSPRSQHPAYQSIKKMNQDIPALLHDIFSSHVSQQSARVMSKLEQLAEMAESLYQYIGWLSD